MKPWMRRTEKNGLGIKQVGFFSFLFKLFPKLLISSGSLSNLQNTFPCLSHMTLTITRWDEQASNYNSHFIDEATGRHVKWLDHPKWQDWTLQVSAQALTVYVSQAERALLYSLPRHTLLLTLHVSPDPPRGQTPRRQNSIF